MSEAPDRVWITSEIMSIYSNPSCDTDEEYIRRNAACVEVKEGYEVDVVYEGYTLSTLSEALTIRTVEDVRREALEEAVHLLELPSGLMTPPAAQRIRNLINTPAPSREEMAKEADEHGCKIVPDILRGEPQPTPSPEPVPERMWFHVDGAFLPYQPTMHWEWNEYIRKDLQAEELRKAKEEAWDKGYRLGYHDSSCEGCMVHENPYRRSTDEGEG